MPTIRVPGKSARVVQVVHYTRKFPIVALWLLAACAPARPSPSFAPPTATEPPPTIGATHPPAATKTPVPPPPTETPIPRHEVTPLVRANRLRFESWSPNGNWIAYWFSERTQDPGPAHLAFVQTRSGEVCRHEELTVPDIWSGWLIWQDSRSVVARWNEEAHSGSPCEAFAPLEGFVDPDPGNSLPPDGRYLAETSIESEEQLLHNVTTITEVATGISVIIQSWDSSVHAVQRGPRWLNSQLYLIGQTLDQGVLYASVAERRVGNLLTDLFHLEGEQVENLWSVFSHADPSNGNYHILLQWWGGPASSPLLLYHSELDQVEELPDLYSTTLWDGLF